MFIDSVEITVASGKGGAGAVAFRREKFITQGGPEGGDGGRGGDLLFEVDNNTDTLSHYRGNKAYRAQNGRPGGNRNMSGKSGESLTLKVPPGTQVIDSLTGELLLDLTEVGKGICFLQGGKGGLGNSHFKSPTNQRPTYAQPGEQGVVRSVRLELKSIADVGLVGFPNVGKSTLISAVSHAKPKVADYEFTTLIPALGVVQASDYSSFIMADIPGILDGASEGRGLGLDFLKHIERTRVLLFVLDAVGYRTLEEQYEALEAELANYAHGLENRHYGIVFSRVDADPAQAAERIEAFLQHKAFGVYEEVRMGEIALKQYPAKAASGLLAFALPISSVSGFGLQTLVYALDELIRKVRSNADRH